jgi:DNA polymerase epsilon subunit 1
MDDFAARRQQEERLNLLEHDLGWLTADDGVVRDGYLMNIKPTTVQDERRRHCAAVLLYFTQEDRSLFKCVLRYEPYFYVHTRPEFMVDVLSALQRQFSEQLVNCQVVGKTDLDQPNHLAGLTNPYIKLSFRSVHDLMNVRKRLKRSASAVPRSLFGELQFHDYLDAVDDVREFDIIYYTRVMIDMEVRCGLWYEVAYRNNNTILKVLPDKLTSPNLKVFAFDIETAKSPLKFPDASRDSIMMISYMIDGEGFLITNRKLVGADIEDLEYTPKPDYQGKFAIFNEEDELHLLQTFFNHIRETNPLVFVTFNGDFFDWPFIQQRALHHGIKMEDEIGVNVDNGEFKSRASVHMDCFYWVKRDAYLPQGSHGLKKVTKAKLGYEPVEVDPEEMVAMAMEQPQSMATYSVSDAVATYYLYMKMIHDFIFALCTIIPLSPDDVLRKGSGTLCEHLLMAQAFSRDIIFPNKTKEIPEKFYKGHLIDSETYVGGHVECLEVGVYRADVPVRFNLDPTAYQMLITQIDQTIDFCLKVEQGLDPATLTNREAMKEQILGQLTHLSGQSGKDMKPLIYHLDVAAMYPNIILSNRLQPTAVVTEKVCANCAHNRPDSNCKRSLSWNWRGDIFPLQKGEFEGVKAQLLLEKPEATEAEVKERAKEYSRRVYNSAKQTKSEIKKETVCMRENSFYVDTVRAFRDRRYEFKNLVKVAKGQMDAAKARGDLRGTKEGANLMSLYESLQLAHKIILNSFYGYVMRKGARWYSMEMAGMVTHTGAAIITDSRLLVERLGRPLELDTDGIWCMLPEGFPENFVLETPTRKAFMSYPCTMLNMLIYDKFKNPQYQTLVDMQYVTHTEMSVFFEIDGPYRAMIIPASTTEGKMLKKRYAVFNFDGKLTELKGFELKRRGELKLIKAFQEEIFGKFLDGTNIEECYQAVGSVADKWYDFVEYRGQGRPLDEIIEYLGESRVLSRALNDYGSQKSTAIVAARRLGELLGEELVKDKGLNCHLLISKKPDGAAITDRAIPALVFKVEQSLRDKFLKLWLKDPGLTDFTIESIIDWSYYKDRLSTCIQKIITIPAALQRIANPTPRIEHPEWLSKLVRDYRDKTQQRKIDSIFKPTPYVRPAIADLEDAPALRAPPQMPRLIDMTNAPRLEDGLEAWLSFQQVGWRRRREHLQALRKVRGKATPRTVSSFIKSTEERLLHSNWHVIGLYPSEVPGVFRMWVFTDQLHCVKLSVPRSIFVSYKTPHSHPDFNPVRVTLPHCVTSEFVYEYRLTEEDFQDKYCLLASALADPQIEGVYETQLPSLTLALISIGSVIRPKFGKFAETFHRQGNISAQVFSSPDFDIKNDVVYLKADQLHHVFLVHLANAGRQVWFVMQPGMKSAVVYIQQTGLADKSSLQKVLRDALKDQEWEVQTEYFPDLNKLLKALNQGLLSDKRSNSILHILSPDTTDELRRLGLTVAVNDIPVLRVHIQSPALPALDWQRSACRLAAESLELAQEKLMDKIGFAQYASVPVANIEDDATLFLSDLLFARSLKSSKSLLWWSSSPHPDLGGGEAEQLQVMAYSDFKFNTVLVPGLYTEIVVELDLGVLATTAILCYKHFFDFEPMEPNPEDERTLVAPVFRKLRGLVSAWLEDVKAHRNYYADKLVMHCYRWLSNPKSCLYDPFLHLTLHQLIKQMFTALLQECVSLGAEVVYAHSDKLILNTRKRSLQDAVNYCDYIVRNLTSQPSFSFISLQPTRFWRVLLFKDAVNYAGVIAKEDPSAPIRVSSNWHITEALPEHVAKVANAYAAEFVYTAAQLVQIEAEDQRAAVLASLQSLLTSEILQRLLDFVPHLERVEEFPRRPGGQLKTHDSALEFIKVLSHIYELEPELADASLMLRRSVLKKLKIRSFGDEADYVEPFAAVIVPEVICPACVYVRDIDLCSDPMLSKGEWMCGLCNAPMTKSSFEAMLTASVQKQLLAYQLQDLQCQRCKLNRCDLLSERCACAGPYALTEDKESLMKSCQTLYALAEFHDFGTLKGLLSQLMGLPSS